jgi:4-hydroxyacetophenone monooxygenase
LGCVQLSLQREDAALDVHTEVNDAYNQKIDRGNELMAWDTLGVQSWYKNEAGHVTQNWPFMLLEFWRQTQEPNPADYEFLEARVPEPIA